MKSKFVVTLSFLTLAACASTGSPNKGLPELSQSGLQAGKFVEFTCESGRFSARLAQDHTSIRVRTIQGSAELERQADTTWAADGFVLALSGANGIELKNNDKLIGKNCKPQN